MDLITTALCGEKCFALSSIVPLVRGVQHSINLIDCKLAVGMELKIAMLSVLSQRLGNHKKDKISADSIWNPRKYRKRREIDFS